MSKVTCKVCGNPEAEGSHDDWGDFIVSCYPCRLKSLQFDTIEKFKGQFKGITYTGEVLWDKQERESIVNVNIEKPDVIIKVQEDSYKSAIQETKRLINEHFEKSKKKDSKTFILIRIGSEDDYTISEYYQDYEDENENLWISCYDEETTIEEVVDIPGVWNAGDKYYVAVETKEDLYNSPVNEELKNLPMEVLRNAQKFVAKRVKDLGYK